MSTRLRIVSRLAWRNLWRNHRRTLIMLAAIAVGSWAMIAMTAFLRGMVDEMVGNGIRALPGQVQIHHPDYLDDPSVANRLAMPEGALAAALAAPTVDAWSARVRVPAVASSERDSRGVVLLGVDPASEQAIGFVASTVIAGRALESVDDAGVVVGERLLERLETALGKRIVLMSQDPNNQIVDRGFRIVGVFRAKIRAHEEQFVLTGRTTLQRLLGVGDEVSEVAVLGPDYRHVEGLRQQLATAAGSGLAVEAWSDLDPYLGSSLKMMDGFVWVWIVVIFLALSFGLVNTLVMAVFERVREIGLMLALGMRPGDILLQVLVESMLLLVLGLAAGNLLAWGTVVWLADGIDLSMVAEAMEEFGTGTVLYPALKLADLVAANLIVLGLGLLASLSPAWRASRYQPVEAITKV